MADLQNKLTGNYYIAWLSRCDDAWRWLLSDRGPYTPLPVLKKQHHADCQRIAKALLLTQLADKMQAKRLGLKSNPGKRHSAGFASRAQQRWAFGTGQSFARKWARKTTFKRLPEGEVWLQEKGVTTMTARERHKLLSGGARRALRTGGTVTVEVPGEATYDLTAFPPRPGFVEVREIVRSRGKKLAPLIGFRTPQTIARYLNPRLSRSLRRYSLGVRMSKGELKRGYRQLKKRWRKSRLRRLKQRKLFRNRGKLRSLYRGAERAGRAVVGAAYLRGRGSRSRFRAALLKKRRIEKLLRRDVGLVHRRYGF